MATAPELRPLSAVKPGVKLLVRRGLQIQRSLEILNNHGRQVSAVYGAKKPPCECRLGCADCALKYPVYLCGAVCAAQGLILAAEGRFLENVFVF